VWYCKNVMQSYTYRIIIEPDERNTFHAYVPALPGCHTWGESINQARKNIQDAIDVYIRSLIVDGLDVPQDNGFEFVATVSFTPRTSLKKKSSRRVYA